LVARGPTLRVETSPLAFYPRRWLLTKEKLESRGGVDGRQALILASDF
jgi:hypothetical protein